MGGIGKTTLAKNVYEIPLIVQHFDIRAWTTISQEYNVKEILFELFRNQGSQGSSRETSEEELGEMLYKNLYGRRYLIITDDMWNIESWDKLKRYLSQNNCESRIIITSRLSSLASHIPGAYGLQMSFLNEDKSWNLFCRTVFGEDGCPPELEKIGKNIAKRCEGLPLSIVVTGGLLAKSEQTHEYWTCIAKNLSSAVNLEDNERCLNMSYNYLPVHLKPCFLYMGVYSEDSKICISELIKFWVAEGFLKPIRGKRLEEVAEEYLKALVERNLILVDEWKHNGKPKLCKMHDLLRDLCLREAEKDKFLCVIRLQSLDKFPQEINTQRRIAIHRRRSLFQEKDEYYFPEIRDAIRSATLARSLIYISSKILPSCNSRLSRVLKAYDDGGGPSHFLEFPFQLVNLRYLANATNWIRYLLHRIPSSVYLLWNPRTLVVNHVPTNDVDIWKMPLLWHVKLMSLHLDNPGQDGFVLWNLQTLSTIRNFKWGEEVVKRIPNIRKLKISYNSDALTPSHYCVNYLGRLQKLESLNCGFPAKPSWSDAVQNLTFPHFLKKLTLEGCYLHWGDISRKIGSLPYLQVLKLYWNSCIGTEWETVEDQFLSLKFLKFDGKKLEHWTTEASHFPCLEHLFLDNLWSLKEIPSDIGNIPTLKLFEMDSCSSGAIVSAKEIAGEQNDLDNQDLQVRVRYRYDISYDIPYEEIKRMTSYNFLLGF